MGTVWRWYKSPPHGCDTSPMTTYVAWSVSRFVCSNFLRGREVTLPCSYRSTCFYSRQAEIFLAPSPYFRREAIYQLLTVRALRAFVAVGQSSRNTRSAEVSPPSWTYPRVRNWFSIIIQTAAIPEQLQPPSSTITSPWLLEVQLPYEPPVSVGWSVCYNFLKGGGRSYTSMLLSEHLLCNIFSW